MSTPSQDNKVLARHLASTFGGHNSIHMHRSTAGTKSIPIASSFDSWEGYSCYSSVGMSDVTFLKESIGVEICGVSSNDVNWFAEAISTVCFMQMDDLDIYPGKTFLNIFPLFNERLLVKHVLLTYPSFWDDKLTRYRLDNKTVVWLMIVPVTESELSYINKYGLDDFESTLVRNGVDIMDINRESSV